MVSSYDDYRDEFGQVGPLPASDGQRQVPGEGFYTGPEIGEPLPGFTTHEAHSRLGAALGNEHYQGQAFGWIFLLLMGAMNLFRGSVHLLKSDGGASSIAGIDLSLNGEVILMLFATMGLVQLLMAGVDFAVGLRYRALVPVLVGFHLLQQIGAASIVWWWRPLPLPAPGKYGTLVLLPVVLLAFFSATRRSRASSPASASVAEGAH